MIYIEKQNSIHFYPIFFSTHFEFKLKVLYKSVLIHFLDSLAIKILGDSKVYAMFYSIYGKKFLLGGDF